MQVPVIIKGGSHQDQRGEVTFNNSFDASAVKRIYIISNTDSNPVRGWQGHKIESRWFSCIKGSFEIALIPIDDWEFPNKNKEKQQYILKPESLDVLFTPPGYISKLHMLEPDSKLLVMSNFMIGEVQDEYRFDINYFN